MRIRRHHFEIAGYVAPCLPARIKGWWQRSPEYRHGFVLRVFWFGFVLRWQHNTPWWEMDEDQSY